MHVCVDIHPCCVGRLLGCRWIYPVVQQLGLWCYACAIVGGGCCAEDYLMETIVILAGLGVAYVVAWAKGGEARKIATAIVIVGLLFWILMVWLGANYPASR